MTIFYHGGSPLIRGIVMPPAATGASSSSDYGAGHVHRRDRVYVSTSYDAALIWASLHPSLKGRVYIVSPVGEIEPDPDCNEPGLSYQCQSARVISVIRPKAKHMAKIRRWMLADLRGVAA